MSDCPPESFLPREAIDHTKRRRVEVWEERHKWFESGYTFWMAQHYHTGDVESATMMKSCVQGILYASQKIDAYRDPRTQAIPDWDFLEIHGVRE